MLAFLITFLPIISFILWVYYKDKYNRENISILLKYFILEETANTVRTMSLCGLGKSAPLPVISTLELFRHEYEEHIVDGKCRAHVCSALKTFKIDPDKCKGCTKCARNCPVGAITGEKKEAHVIDTTKCIKCGACMEGCKFDAIYAE